MSKYPDRVILQLIEFSFSDHQKADYIRSQGYPARLLPSQVNAFLQSIEKPGSDIPEYDLHREVPFWDDTRTSYIWSCIKRGDLHALIKNVKDEYYWELLFAKMRLVYDGETLPIADLYYKRWKLKMPFERSAVKREKKHRR
jgi:hypothetical protein